MQRRVGILSFVALVLILSLSGTDAKFYKDYFAINSRVPGDELVKQSTVSQHMDFRASVRIVYRYPEDLSHSEYQLSHFLVTGEDDTGYIKFKSDGGGPGADNMNCKIILESVENGDYQVYLFGKKK